MVSQRPGEVERILTSGLSLETFSEKCTLSKQGETLEYPPLIINPFAGLTFLLVFHLDLQKLQTFHIEY